MKYIVGIDIGISGAIVIMNAKNCKIVEFYPMPVIEKTLTSKTKKGEYKKRNVYDEEVLERIIYNLTKFDTSRRHLPDVFIEKPQAMPGQASNAIGTAFEGFGFIKGLLLANGFEYTEVHPATWASKVFKGMKRGKGKERSLKLFKKNYPKINLDEYLKRYHDGITDATHIARYGCDMIKGV